jgi:hypothetical protein
MQGISPIPPFSAKTRLGNVCESSSLQQNSLRGAQGINSRQQGISSASWLRAARRPAETVISRERSAELLQRESLARPEALIAIAWSIPLAATLKLRTVPFIGTTNP